VRIHSHSGAAGSRLIAPRSGAGVIIGAFARVAAGRRDGAESRNLVHGVSKQPPERAAWREPPSSHEKGRISHACTATTAPPPALQPSNPRAASVNQTAVPACPPSSSPSPSPAICYFALSATFINQNAAPSASLIRGGIFQAAPRDKPRLPAAVLHFFQSTATLLPCAFDVSFAGLTPGRLATAGRG